MDFHSLSYDNARKFSFFFVSRTHSLRPAASQQDYLFYDPQQNYIQPPVNCLEYTAPSTQNPEPMSSNFNALLLTPNPEPMSSNFSARLLTPNHQHCSEDVASSIQQGHSTDVVAHRHAVTGLAM